MNELLEILNELRPDIDFSKENVLIIDKDACFRRDI